MEANKVRSRPISNGMKIALVGGGTGGHFYPLVAVAEALEDLCNAEKLLMPELVYIGPPPFDPAALLEHSIWHITTSAGKVRRYSSILNVFDTFKTAFSIVHAIPLLYKLYPDVIFSTGGFAAFPLLVAAKILRIPVVIYDADAKPGRVSLWSAKFARYIAVAHPSAVEHFPTSIRSNIARVGHPVRKEILTIVREGGYEFLHLDPAVPSVLILGGSQGARTINEVVLDALPELSSRYNIVHQTGKEHLKEVSDIASVALRDTKNALRYHPFGLLNTLALKMAAGAASVVVARAGSGTIFEIAAWGTPAILVPIPLDVSHDQTENAFSYARAGAAEVIEQQNLSPHILISEIDRLYGDEALRKRMAEAGKQFARPDAATKLARTLLDISIAHEPR